MGINKTLLRWCACVMLAALPLATSAGIAKNASSGIAGIGIDNFGRINLKRGHRVIELAVKYFF